MDAYLQNFEVFSAISEVSEEAFVSNCLAWCLLMISAEPCRGCSAEAELSKHLIPVLEDVPYLNRVVTSGVVVGHSLFFDLLIGLHCVGPLRSFREQVCQTKGPGTLYWKPWTEDSVSRISSKDRWYCKRLQQLC